MGKGRCEGKYEMGVWCRGVVMYVGGWVGGQEETEREVSVCVCGWCVCWCFVACCACVFLCFCFVWLRETTLFVLYHNTTTLVGKCEGLAEDEKRKHLIVPLGVMKNTPTDRRDLNKVFNFSCRQKARNEEAGREVTNKESSTPQPQPCIAFSISRLFYTIQ